MPTEERGTNVRRLFVAIPIPEELKREIVRVFSNVHLPRAERMRIVPEKNWHFTVIFLGDQEEETTGVIQDSMESVVASHGAGEIMITLEQIVYGPFSSRRDARGIWLTTDKESSRMIASIKNNLQNELQKRGVVWGEQEREYQGHLTLARFESVPIQTLPPLRIPVNRSYRAESLELVESHLSREGAKYETISGVHF